jgi:hypothetical protein
MLFAFRLAARFVEKKRFASSDLSRLAVYIRSCGETAMDRNGASGIVLTLTADDD